jgi:hypothetical protein
MHLGEISFCGKIGYNIKSDDFKKRLLDTLEEHMGFKVIQKHHEKYREELLPMLNKNPHVLSVRTNGNPYLLYLTKYNFANQCIFIDKKIQHGYFYPRMIIAKLWFDDVLYDGTLFDGEMVKTNDGNWEFVINDILHETKGCDLQKMNVVKRINRVYEILDKYYKEDDVTCCNIRVKKFFTYDQAKVMMDEFIPSLNYTCRGIYFKPLYLKFRDILINFDDSLIKSVVRTKYKDINQSTFITSAPEPKAIETTVERQTAPIEKGDSLRTFIARKTPQPDIYELIDMDTPSTIHVACIPGMATSKMMRVLFAGATLTDKKKVLCKYHEKFLKWVPIQES